MGDSVLVIERLIDDARTLGYLENIRTELGSEEQFQRWCSYADTQGTLAL